MQYTEARTLQHVMEHRCLERHHGQLVEGCKLGHVPLTVALPEATEEGRRGLG